MITLALARKILIGTWYMLSWLDSLIDKITMYRLLIYYLLVILGAAMVLGGLNIISYSPVAIALCTSYLVVICWATHAVFRVAFGVAANFESTLITALILALIITPLATTENLLFLTAAGGLAISSKYILAVRKVHIFNPATIAVVLTALGAEQTASWWVGTTQLLPVVLLGGLLVMRKVQRDTMVLGFFVVALASVALFSVLGHSDVAANVQKTLTHSPMFFMGFVMLTEPLTSPATKAKQFWYGVFAGAILPPQAHIGSVYSTPELVLVVSNVLSFFISPKRKLAPRLVKKETLAPDVADFIFAIPKPLAYKPGQYMEWTLPHDQPDSRSIRRYFTLASSPTEDTLRVGVKFYPQGSTYKSALIKMDADTPITAAQLAGDFVMPRDPSRKLAFIAGGIGVTPFRSMLKYLVDTKETRDVALLYSERTVVELCYRDIFSQARAELGAKIIYTLTDETAVPPWARAGHITPELIVQEIPDFKERLFYISGPHGMVHATQHALRQLGVSSSHIKIDFFPGYNG